MMTLALLALGPAHAAPVDLTHQLRVLDASGLPVNGPHHVELRLVGDSNPSDRDVNCFVQVHEALHLTDGYASVLLDDVPDACFDSPHWLAVRVGSPATELGPRTPLTTSPSAARAGEADSVNGVTFAVDGGRNADIKAYIDSLFCERFGGAWNDSNGTCDANMVVGTGSSYTNTACPTNYRVCTLPEAAVRMPNTTITGWHWVSHEAGAPNSGNLDQNANRYSYPHCPASGNAPLIYSVASSHGGSELRNVICYTSGYTPLCCK